MAEHYAHIREDGKRQTVKEHSLEVGDCAARAAGPAGLAHTARVAGWLHDAGKCKEAFQKYLQDAVAGRPVHRGSVNHSFAGARYVLTAFHDLQGDPYAALTAELIGFAVGAHHGLFDCMDERQQNGFSHRQDARGIDYEESMEHFFAQCVPEERLLEEFRLAVGEVTALFSRIDQIAAPAEQHDEEVFFYLGLAARGILSGVIEGDRRDTARFMNDKEVPRWPEDMTPIWKKSLRQVERTLQGFSKERPIDRARQIISDRCGECGKSAGGIFRLNVPTGGGKTLSGLRFALTHGARWNKARIFFLSPLLSILDQNAQVIRDAVKDDRLILEHHSNLVRPTQDGKELDRLELLMENWDTPMVITTLVQFLNTLFSGKTGCIRRFHAVFDSVIVIDEVQTVPDHMLSLFDLAMTFLSQICGATILLCSATQPCLEEADHPLRYPPTQVVGYDEALWQVFRRTTIQDGGTCSLEELPGYIQERLEACRSLLVVCNKKDQAEYLFRQTQAEGVGAFHLSAAMCVAHRRQVLAEIQKALKENKKGGPKVLCISTQVVEAGVDISFQQVLRLSAGMDSVVQSAGRCNRNGEDPTPQPVTVLRCAGERLDRLRQIRRGQAATESLLYAYRKDPDRFDRRLDSDQAIAYYYRKLYKSMDQGHQDYVVTPHGRLLDLLALNERYATAYSQDVDRYVLHQAFRLAGNLFQVFDQDTIDVLVPYQEGRQIREKLIRAAQTWDYDQLRTLLEEARPYTVSMYRYQIDRLQAQGALIQLFDGRALALTDGYYHEATGFSLKNIKDFWEVSK